MLGDYNNGGGNLELRNSTKNIWQGKSSTGEVVATWNLRAREHSPYRFYEDGSAHRSSGPGLAYPVPSPEAADHTREGQQNCERNVHTICQSEHHRSQGRIRRSGGPIEPQRRRRYC